jgi:hypothetical protein
MFHEDLHRYVDRFGHIAVDIKVSDPTRPDYGHEMGFSHTPGKIASCLREIAAEVEAAGEPVPPPGHYPCCLHCSHAAREAGHVLSCSSCLRELCDAHGAQFADLLVFINRRQ